MSGTVDKTVKKMPMRRCLGCGESFPKKDLIRVVHTPDDTICLDFRGKVSGRGAYICKKAACLKKAKKAGRYERNLGCEIPDSVYEELEKELIAENE